MDVSLLISTYRRPQLLRRVLRELGRQTMRSFEVIVCDDGSGDETPAVVRAHAATAPYPVHFATQEHRGFRYALARNRGARVATSPLLAFINDDCIPAPSFLESYRKALAAGGRYLRGEIIFVRSWDALDQVIDRHLPTQGMWGSNFAIARDLFLQIGGFDEDFVDQTGEDTDLERRLSLMKVRGVGVPGAHVYHQGGSHSGGQPNTLYCKVKVHDNSIRRNVARWR